MSKVSEISQSSLVGKPVRRIGIQSRSITGTMPEGGRYESALERDFMLLLDFDYRVKLYTPQPLSLPYKGIDSKWHRYTPDVLVEYFPEYKSLPLLVEIKYRDDFRGKFREWMPRFSAANQYAAKQNWCFEIITDGKIRTPFLQNVKFLLGFREIYDVEFQLMVHECLEADDEKTPNQIINAIFKDRWNQATLLPILWGMVARREIGCDLFEAITMASRVWKL